VFATAILSVGGETATLSCSLVARQGCAEALWIQTRRILAAETLLIVAACQKVDWPGPWMSRDCPVWFGRS
jgi:hypothetical protein